MGKVIDLLSERRKRELKEKTDLLSQFTQATTKNHQIDEATAQDISQEDKIDYDFDSIASENKKRQQKLEAERQKANQQVKRNFRLPSNDKKK